MYRIVPLIGLCFSDVFAQDSHFFVSVWDRGQSQETFLGFVRVMPPRTPGKYYDAWFK
jgi:hypothetical protein